MANKKMSNVRLGLFVLIGSVLLIMGLYFIGNNRNLFDSTFTVKATFYKVNGLRPGNNVRFSGIDVGTVKSIRIDSDTTVEVTMVVEEHAMKFIKKNAVASVGSDGLMGNKLVEIDNSREPAPSIEDGDMIHAMRTVETDQMLRILERTTKDLAEISAGLKSITGKINGSHALWTLLSDSGMAEDFRQSTASIRAASEEAASFAHGLNGFLQDMKNEEGMIQYLIYDTLAPGRLRESLMQIDRASDAAMVVTADLNDLTRKIKRGEGAAGILLSDTVFAGNLNETMENVRAGSVKLNENMEALRHHFLFRGYFKKQEKEAKKTQEEANRKK